MVARRPDRRPRRAGGRVILMATSREADVPSQRARVRRLIVAVALALPMIAVPATAAQAVTAQVPGQFVAKLYTEGLGRFPDPTGWRAYLSNIQDAGCGPASLRQQVRSVYLSTEF